MRFNRIGYMAIPEQRSISLSPEEVETSVPERFERQVLRYSNQLAVKSKKGAVTYHELNRAANITARAVLQSRPKTEEPVVLLFEHDLPMIVGFMAVLKAGKICVVLDPSNPEARARRILEDSRAKVVVTNTVNLSLARRLAQQREHLIINIDELDSNIAAENLACSISPNAPACIVYTSGSSGEPKGVVQNHRNVIHNATRYATGCGLGTEDRVTLLASLSTGQGIPTTFGTLLSGAALYLFNFREEGIAGLSKWLSSEGITVYVSAPTLFRQFVETLTGHENFPKLRMIRLGAEQVQKRDVKLHQEHFSENCTLGIFLSATETGNICQYFINKQTKIPTDRVPVGYAVDGVEILLLDDSGKELGFNEIGEIAVRSRYVSPGYWRRPDLTESAFLPDPGGADTRTYRTGDLGRMQPDGCLQHLGRKDFQVKIRGFRIELQEIELLLRKHPMVKEAIVEARQKDSGKWLVAYVVPKSREQATVTELSNYLKQTLPDYAVPSAWVVLDSLPVTPLGKVDRRLLPEPGKARPVLNTLYTPPRTPLEDKLARIWGEVLCVNRVGIHDNLVELGGHSLLVARLIVCICAELGVNLPLRALFECPTIAQLAARINMTPSEGFHSGSESKTTSCLVKLQSGQSEATVFCFPYFGGFRGDLLTFARLARLIGGEYSFYALQARGTDGRSQPHRYVEEIAGEYLKTIQSVQPHGPYFLLGECFGAAVAYETAQQLEGRGEKVALLVFLDAKCIRQSFARHLWRRVNARMLYRIWSITESWTATEFHLGQIRQLEHGSRLRYCAEKFGKIMMHASYALRGARPLHPQWANVDGNDAGRRKSKHLQRAEKAYWLAVRRYRPRPYAGRITLLVNEEWYRPDSNLKWDALAAGGLQVHKIPGNHVTYVTEYIQVAAKALRDCLEKASNDPAGLSPEKIRPPFQNVWTDRKRNQRAGA